MSLCTKNGNKFVNSDGDYMHSSNNEILIERIESLAKEKKLSPTTVYVESGAGKNFKCNLKTANPSLGKVTLIANYLGTTAEYLLGETDKKEKSSEQTEGEELVSEFIELLNGLTDEQMKSVFDYIEFIKRKE